MNWKEALTKSNQFIKGLLDKKLDKIRLQDAGIQSISWSTVLAEQTITTTEDIYKDYRPSGTNTRYWAEFSGCPYFKNRQLYRVTFNGTLYDNLVCDYGILVDDGTGSVIGDDTTVGGSWQLIGNKYLFDSRYESTGEPFCFMVVEHGGMKTQGSYYYSSTVGNGILFTESASTNTVIIERATITSIDLPKNLFNNFGYGDRTYQNIASSTYSRMSLGQGNIVGRGSFAIGESNISTGQSALAEGIGSTASGYCSHAEGNSNNSTNAGSHAEGNYNTASGMASHVEGEHNLASSVDQHVEGHYNIEDASKKYVHIVGNGTSDTARSNAHTLDWSGNAWYAGDVYIGGASQDDESAEKLAKQSEIKVTDIQINGTTVLADGVANIPIANTDVLGVVKFSNSYGVETYNGFIHPSYLTRSQYVNNLGELGFIGKGTLEIIKPYYVKEAMTSTTDTAWTDDEKKSARQRMGCDFVVLTQTEYDELETKDENTTYYVTEE